MKKLLIGLLVLLVLAVGADRLAAHVAGQVVAGKLRTTAGLDKDPQVTVTGFPFLTQALAGRYDRIVVDARDLDRGGAHLTRLHVDLLGARIPAGQALKGNISSVPVEGLRGTATLAYADLVGGHTELQVAPLPGNQVRVTGTLTVLGQRISASTRSSVRLSGRSLVITAQSVSVEGQRSDLLDKAIAGRFDLRVPLGSLPYGLELTGVRTTSAGVEADAVSGPTVLTAG